MQTSARTTSHSGPRSDSLGGGLLQRKCDCGNHTVAGGECAECEKNSRSPQHEAIDPKVKRGFPVPRIPVIQRKMTIGANSDPLEQEADQIADLVLVASTHPAVSKAAPRIQRYTGQATTEAGEAPVSVDRVLASPGRPLNPVLQEDMEGRFGHDFSRVRIHSEGVAEQSARELKAKAYTVGQHIVFGADRFAPQMQEGRRLLAHELTHVVQQLDSPRITTVFRAVNPTPTVRLNRTALLGDGTAANVGIKLDEFQGYLSKQADWFVEPSLSEADRELLWSLADFLQEGDHIGAGLANLTLADLGAATAVDMKSIRAYAAGAATTAQTVRITQPDDKIARVIQLGTAMLDLAKFVPGPVLRICIDQTGLETLVDENLIPVLRNYYATFAPTIENPEEQAPLLNVLRGGLALFATLSDWVHDLHIFTPPTRVRLVANVKDKTRKKPVLLVLMSGLDWNAAFLQAKNLEAAVLNNNNLALIIQGANKLSDETAKINQTADDYGQIPKVGAKGRLGQVIIAGHGAANRVQQATAGTGATGADDKFVRYNQEKIAPVTAGDDSELLIDALLSRMNPADARVVFAGCLVGSHDVPEAAISSTKTAAAEINAALKANPNLRDLVNQRMAALKIKGDVQAANSSTTFEAFNLDAAGKARLSLRSDPDVGGSKKAYVKTGVEPEGALRAALETWADPKLGPTWTTNEMRAHVAATAASKDWWASITRTAFEFALPKAGDVDPAVIDNLAHRVEPWLLAGWYDTVKPDVLAGAVKATEAPVLYPVMLISDHGTHATLGQHLGLVVEEAWMQVDPAHEASFLTAIGATSLKRTKLSPLIKDGLVNPHLPGLLKTPDPATPSRSQLLLALVIAVRDAKAMPAEVQTLLSGAAGGVRTTTFPAGLAVSTLLDGASELAVLQNIGLAPGASATPKGKVVLDDGNADLDRNKINETFILVSPRPVTLGSSVYVRTLPNRDPASKVTTELFAGDVIRVVGTTAGWTAIDLKGQIGFVNRIFK